MDEWFTHLSERQNSVVGLALGFALALACVLVGLLGLSACLDVDRRQSRQARLKRQREKQIDAWVAETQRALKKKTKKRATP